MKRKQSNQNFKYRYLTVTIIIFVIFTFFIYGCANNLETKIKSEPQQLNQIFQVKSPLQVGDSPYNFTVVTTEGKAVRISDFIENKKPIIIYFFATWCPWCAKDYAALSKVYKNYEDKVSILSISLDLSEDLNILREYKKKYPALQKTMFAAGQTEILVNYRITKTTTKYAIDRNGKIILIGAGAFDEEQWKQLLDALVKSDEAKSVKGLPVTSEKVSVIEK
ncbi:TlpA family protein disulfide reductase [Candidatus Woesearchaeota archaeon]|nr:TlpA family protein disulfide reductase [Candidatus Woesearchaeota archaeon]